MLEIFSSTAEQGMQNVYTPLSLKTHFIFCILATVLYLVQFYRRGSWHYLFIMAAIDLTFATQTSLCQTAHSVTILGFIEIALLICALIFYIMFAKKRKSALASVNEQLDEENRRQREADKKAQSQDRHLVDNAFEDKDE